MYARRECIFGTLPLTLHGLVLRAIYVVLVREGCDNSNSSIDRIPRSFSGTWTYMQNKVMNLRRWPALELGARTAAERTVS
jgi:hypothetical protein